MHSRDRDRDRIQRLHHERLDGYQVAIEFLAVAVAIQRELPKGFGLKADQLRRAAMSIPLNIAEGNGKVTPRDKARFFRIGRGSACERGAILDACKVMQVVAEDRHHAGKWLLVRLVAMLSKLSDLG